MRLEDLQIGTRVRGLTAEGVATVKAVTWFGDQAVEVIFDGGRGVQNRLVYREDEPSLDLVASGRPWSFDGDGALLRLVSEAQRIRLAWLFDPYLAVTTSIIEPLPHQISAVYEEMLPRQPMRFLLADDPGAGKTIMAGLLIRELMVRGELERCLIISPGSITEQWQDELAEKFGLEFDLLLDRPEPELPQFSDEELDDIYEEAGQEAREQVEQALVDNATAARTIEELETEILRLKELEVQARAVRLSGVDAKWMELNSILDHPLMTDEKGNRRKIVIFTEFRDTLAYLADRIRTRLGKPESVVEIHGGVTREERRKTVHAFMNDPTVLVLVANDAAGEGVNLQRAHLMVNYDLPWNPNRLEQRFGRIHRIGQTEVCHLWNLMAKDTREGEVYLRLLTKLEAEREALGGKVYDVLGQLFEQRALRDLLMEAIRYGNDPAVKARLNQAVDDAVDRRRLRHLLDVRALSQDSMDTSRIQTLREEMERAHARRLQPNYIQAFFQEAFDRLGGKMHRREPGRFEVTHVPVAVRDRDRQVGAGAPVLKRYERICFEKDLVADQPRAYLVCPGSPLLDATIDLVLERHRDILKRGAVLVDENDPGEEPRLLFYLEHAITDGRYTRRNEMQVVSQRMCFAEVRPDGIFADVGAAPYLDYRPASSDDLAALRPDLDADWLRSQDWESRAFGFAIREVVPVHMREVKVRRLPLIAKVEQEVKARLQKEINYWDHRAADLKAQEQAGKQTRLPAADAQRRADLLADRMKRRLSDLAKERLMAPRPPSVLGGALIVPLGLLRKRLGQAVPPEEAAAADARDLVERLAMEAVFAAERALGREPRDVSAQRGIGYDIESRDPASGLLVFVEVKGRAGSQDQVTLTRTEVLCGLNEPEKFRLAIVQVEDNQARPPIYVRGFDWGQPGFAQTSSTFSLASLLARGGSPS